MLVTRCLVPGIYQSEFLYNEHVFPHVMTSLYILLLFLDNFHLRFDRRIGIGVYIPWGAITGHCTSWNMIYMYVEWIGTVLFPFLSDSGVTFLGWQVKFIDPYCANGYHTTALVHGSDTTLRHGWNWSLPSCHEYIRAIWAYEDTCIFVPSLTLSFTTICNKIPENSKNCVCNLVITSYHWWF